MKSKYYKQIINTLDFKLEQQEAENKRLKSRIESLEASSREKDVMIANLKTDLLIKGIINENDNN